LITNSPSPRFSARSHTWRLGSSGCEVGLSVCFKRGARTTATIDEHAAFASVAARDGAALQRWAHDLTLPRQLKTHTPERV
jgi:hypothetical protein